MLHDFSFSSDQKTTFSFSTAINCVLTHIINSIKHLFIQLKKTIAKVVNGIIQVFHSKILIVKTRFLCVGIEVINSQ